MILHQVIVITLTAAANQQVSTTRINARNLEFKSRRSNTHTARVGMPTWTESTRTFTPPTDPLSDTTQNTFTLEPGEIHEIPIRSWDVEHGDAFDLRRYYVQGTDGEVIEAHYSITVEA